MSDASDCAQTSIETDAGPLLLLAALTTFAKDTEHWLRGQHMRGVAFALPDTCNAPVLTSTLNVIWTLLDMPEYAALKQRFRRWGLNLELEIGTPLRFDPEALKFEFEGIISVALARDPQRSCNVMVKLERLPVFGPERQQGHMQSNDNQDSVAYLTIVRTSVFTGYTSETLASNDEGPVMHDMLRELIIDCLGTQELALRQDQAKVPSQEVAISSVETEANLDAVVYAYHHPTMQALLHRLGQQRFEVNFVVMVTPWFDEVLCRAFATQPLEFTTRELQLEPCYFVISTTLPPLVRLAEPVNEDPAPYTAS